MQGSSSCISCSIRAATATLVTCPSCSHPAYWWNHLLLPGAGESVEPGWYVCGPPTWEGTLYREGQRWKAGVRVISGTAALAQCHMISHSDLRRRTSFCQGPSKRQKPLLPTPHHGLSRRLMTTQSTDGSGLVGNEACTAHPRLDTWFLEAGASCGAGTGPPSKSSGWE